MLKTGTFREHLNDYLADGAVTLNVIRIVRKRQSVLSDCLQALTPV
jgi:hypothetical protein